MTSDDAAVYQITDDRAIVATVDFFTPIVDDAYAFGAIAAANAFSDLYAMGATPLFALNLVAWPRDPEMLTLLGEAVRGSADVARDAGAFIMGGHSIDDPEPKLGMVAIGEVRPDSVITNAGAKPGDHLVLTKPLGTGILSTALKQELVAEDALGPAISSMTTLNAGAMEAMREVGSSVHAATDVTGFGLLGHAHNILTASGVGARLNASSIPAFDSVRELITRGAVPGGTKRNIEAAAQYARWAPDVDEETRTLLCDAQTSGGLLIAVDARDVDRLIRALNNRETPIAADIGRLVEDRDATIEVAHGEP